MKRFRLHILCIRAEHFLEGRVAIKKQEMDSVIDTFKSQELCIEIESLQRLLAMVRMQEAGEPLDGMAYLFPSNLM